MLPDDLARRMRHLWAKGGGASLLNHTLDVCGQASRFLNVYKPQWAIPCNLHRVLAYATFLHDFGKVHPDFQSMLRDKSRFNNRHEVLSLAFLAWLEIPEAEFPWIAAAIATHHKSWSDIQDGFAHDSGLEQSDLNRLSRGVPEADALLLHELLGHAPQIFAELGWCSFDPYPLREYAHLDYKAHILRALSQIKCLLNPPPANRGPLKPGPPPERDWGPVIAGIHARGWMLSADHLASFGPQPLTSAFQSCEDVTPPEGKTWRPHQEALAAHNGSALLVAPTGSGKTEAALLWAARQAQSGTTGRLCILLPYQASLNAMQKRLLKQSDPSLLDHPDKWNEHVGLLHGRASRHLYEAFLKLDYAPEKAAVNAKEQNGLARLFAAPVAVSTVFSLVRLLFATRGAERLFTSFYGARIVVDEVHAYNPQTTAATLAALKFITKRLDARVLFMSATVPHHLKQALLETMHVEMVPEQPPWGERIRHRLTLLPIHSQSDEAVNRIVEASKNGSVLVVVNQVKRAIRLWERIREHNLAAKLLHSRYNLKDRARIESDLAPEPGRILVATQTVEVSLDLNFDTCFTELAPIESIVQRFGRCNRDSNSDKQFAPVFIFAEYPPGNEPHLPYDKMHMATVRAALHEFCRSESRNFSDADADNLLEASYTEDLKQQLRIQITEKTDDLRRLFLDNWTPFGLAKDERKQLEEQWEALFDGKEVLPESLVPEAKAAGTKLGAASYFVPISHSQTRRFHHKIDWNPELECEVISQDYGPAGLDLHS